MTSTPKHEPDRATATPSTSPTVPHPNDAPTSEPAGITATALQPRIITDTPDVLRVAIGTTILELTGGDIVTQTVDAVVNAANAQLANGGGVCGAIHRAAGAAELQRACQRYHGCPTGEARITSGFALPAKHIIHAVGPIYAAYKKTEAGRLLSSAYRSSLALATEHQLRSIAFPSLSTGIYGFPVEQAAPIAMHTVLDYLSQHQDLELVRFVLWEDTLPIYCQALKQVLGKG